MKILVGGIRSMESAWAGNPNVSGGLVDGSRLFILRGFAKCRWLGEDKQVTDDDDGTRDATKRNVSMKRLIEKFI